MLTSAAINIIQFFYPIGNTPAVSLTQAIPPYVPTNILLLGCGDVWNILFTSHVDGRRMDITCCDLQRAVIARNVLLLSLIIDEKDKDIDSMWNIYYHLYLDDKSLDLLRLQAKKLYEASETMDTWQQSRYGSQFKICDSATLAEIRKMWKLYKPENKGRAEESRFKHRFEAIIQEAKQAKDEKGIGSILTSTRSTSPVHIGQLKDLDDLHKHYWNHGSMTLNSKKRASEKHPNPMMLTLEDDATIHYVTDPLLGFHLAAAYAPLQPNSPLYVQINGLYSIERVVAVAQLEFREWVKSFRKNSANITIRFFVGDAVSFAHTLQYKRITGANTANWPRDQYHLKPLMLDGVDYKSGVAPLAFDVIDTSNLCDHLGSLVLLTAASPLLCNNLSSILYTEAFVTTHNSHDETLKNMLCGHVPTLSTLIGLFPTEYWTNTSSLSAGDEALVDLLMANSKAQQPYLRVCWKRPLNIAGSLGPSSGLIPIQFDTGELASVLYHVYLHMFRTEDFEYLLSFTSLNVVRKSSLVWYHRAGFVSFLRLVKTRVSCDWDETMLALLSLVESRPRAPMGMNYIQELFIYMHMLDVFSFGILKEWHNRHQWAQGPGRLPDRKWEDIRDWSNMPPIVCVTLNIPRQKLSVLTDTNRQQLSTPTVHCLLQGIGRSTWQNISPACQLAFGDITTHGVPNDDSFKVTVKEDDQGWKGSSPLIASFYAPSSFLLLNPRETMVAFGIHSTPASAMVFSSKLGLSMNLYETCIDNSANVYITQHGPHQTGLPVAPGFAQADSIIPEAIAPDADVSIVAKACQETGRIVILTGRFDIKSADYKSDLKGGCQVESSIPSPYEVAIQIGKQQETPLRMYFPVFVARDLKKTRIARKSSYIEAIAQVGTDSDWMKYPYFMYPIHLASGRPVNWNNPYLSLQACPIIDIKQRNKLDWFNPHIATAMSERERALRDNKALPRSIGEQIRLDFKESVFSILIQFAGLQGKKHHLFGLNNEGNGGVHILIMCSSLRIDPASRVVVLDCAVLPLHKSIMSKLIHFLDALGSVNLISVNDAELRLWKTVLPAYVERCRTWEHQDNCEYAKAGSVPLTLEDEEQVICSCGNGEFPPGFLNGVAHWSTVSKFAVRAAISPPFWAPFADNVFHPDFGNIIEGCAACGMKKARDGADLMSCARCRKLKYCSRECQRADWKNHKVVCK
ncbi:hypothetical protein F5X99DRAFT_428791 [Biscogniauxia marginata]|nr:hypothetical protein F5X99DRAFT_428791 [Biscogniauxia marginata]